MMSISAEIRSLLAAVLLILATSALAAEDGQSAPNVVLILADDKYDPREQSETKTPEKRCKTAE